jgi:uncharacterized protein YyaL (SSP411 family)
LLQHRDNPVHWFEWSPEAFAEARERDVPVFLSIGYAACHWCHVMAHESFEDGSTARLINDNFVSIKVDREERPDIDVIYMEATTALTGHGGWPMSVFLLPDGRPFYAGTYFPPTPRGGMPSFKDVLAAITRTWRERRVEVDQAADRISAALTDSSGRVRAGGVATSALVETDLLGNPDCANLARGAVKKLSRQFDESSAGFGGAPKFPPSMVLDFLLLHHQNTSNARALEMVKRTCEAMARGGIYDQLGGGFARYSVDANWVVPHFEKMLYDNALLLGVYARLYAQTGAQLVLRVCKETADFFLREMTTNEGGFAASFDADSEGVEGLYYTWNQEQLVEVLGQEDGQWAAELLSVTKHGTFEHGLSTLQLLADPSDEPRWLEIRHRLHQARSQRIAPGRDDKVIAAWNGMAIASLVTAYRVTSEPKYLAAARRAANLLLKRHVTREGGLKRVSLDGEVGAPDGVLEDYAQVALAFFALADVATAEPDWQEIGDKLVSYALDHFVAEQNKESLTFYDTADDAERLFKRPQDLSDNATPSGSAAMVRALSYSSVGSQFVRPALAGGLGLMAASPRFAGTWLTAAEEMRAPACSITGCT